MSDERRTTSDAKAAVVLGWIAGGGFALLLNFVAFHSFGDGYPVAPTSFVLFVLGAFGGMHLADRLGSRALRVLGIATGALVGLALLVVVALAGG
ncbi:MAG: hypothetical protein H6721_01770 [Sandaracinus sp.]|nr:hypothetical protein [Sandaracinus sp.]MCB9611203.1 hypothetical protein [Sandaracinus sp.]MCB9621045.1 hypothetical protein [Sandaracinus sp.]MCB9630871.1 hypothetical protein [Sandaracinus sp.]